MPLCTALLVAAAAYQANKQCQNKEGDDGASDGKTDSGSEPNITPAFVENKVAIELLPLEQSLTVLEWPVATATFFDCKSTDCLNAMIDMLEQRVKAILRTNPWLGGWLICGKGVGSFDTTPRLWYDPTGQEMSDDIFQRLTHDVVPLDKDTPYIEYETILQSSDGNISATVKTNPEITNRKEEPLFRVTVIPNESNTELAIVVSMSHIIGDGHTYYRIFNQVIGTDPIVPLIPQRELLYSQNVMELMGRQEAHYISHVSTDPAWMKYFARLGSDVSTATEEDEGSELHGRVFLINRHWIGNIKAAHMTEGSIGDVCTSTLRSPMTPAMLNELDKSLNQDDDPTQSTNDILTSWFWNLVSPDVGLMAVNFRGRVDVVGEDHAGNYSNPVPYTKNDYNTPALIRKSLETCRRAGRNNDVTDAPTVLPRASRDLTFSIITNWSSFPPAAAKKKKSSGGPATIEEEDELFVNDIELIRHLPIICPQNMITTMPKRMSYLVIFSSGPDDIGCILLAPGRVMEEIDGCGVVKEIIATF